MSEVTRFRIARAPAAASGSQLKAFRYPTPQDHSAFSQSVTAEQGVEAIRMFLERPSFIASPVEANPFNLPSIDVHNDLTKITDQALLRLLAQFLGWLQDNVGLRERSECLRQLKSLLNGMGITEETPPSRLIELPVWKNVRTALGDSLITAVATGISPQHIAQLSDLFRALHVIELLAVEGSLSTAADVRSESLESLILLPVWLSEARNLLRGEKLRRPLLARAPAFSDLIVVRQEWSCYLPGEIAHIENVLSGELKERSHERMEETETKQETETTTTTSEERDTQSTDRQSVKEEAQQETRLEVGVEGQVDTSGQYGPTHVETHLGARVSYTAQQMRRRATEQSREIVNRAVSKVETRVRELRSTRNLIRITELNKHKLDNTQSTGPVVGIYRWVDKIMRMQTVRYKHRFLLEFQVPEPASYIRWLQSHAPRPHLSVEPPPPFELSPGVPLLASHVDRTNYRELASRFGASGVVAAPDAEVTVSAALDLSSKDDMPENRGSLIEFPPNMNGTLELVVPENYQAHGGSAAVVAHPTLANWHDQESTDSIEEFFSPGTTGYHNVTAGLTVSGEWLTLSSEVGDTVRQGPVPYREAWTRRHTVFGPADFGTFGTGKVQVGVVVGGAFKATVSVSLVCSLKASAFEAWQLETYDRLKEAQRAASDAYAEALNAADVRRDDLITGRPPERNRETVQEELKRQVIEFLMQDTLRGYDLKGPEDPDVGPPTRLAEATAAAPLIQFLEQAFEWGNITYIMYPYYWADDGHWKDLEGLDGTDPEYVRFLRSGSARVIVPARPGFESAVMYFAVTGDPWLGGAPPIPGDELYISVAQEIQEMNSAPDDGEPIGLWEVKLPTTLVWLDPDSNIPKRNEHRRLVGTPAIDFCGAERA
jgi:hypothetical protein